MAWTKWYQFKPYMPDFVMVNLSLIVFMGPSYFGSCPQKFLESKKNFPVKVFKDSFSSKDTNIILAMCTDGHMRNYLIMCELLTCINLHKFRLTRSHALHLVMSCNASDV